MSDFSLGSVASKKILYVAVASDMLADSES